MDQMRPQQASEAIHTAPSALRPWGCWTVFGEGVDYEDDIVRLQDDYGRVDE